MVSESHDYEVCRELIENLPDGVSRFEPGGAIVEVNAALCRMTGFSKKELLGSKPPYPYWAPEHLDTILAAFHETLQNGGGEYELVYRRSNGERFPVLVAAASLRAENGEPFVYFATIKDISERKRVERLHRQSLERLRFATEIGGLVEWELNLDDHSVHRLPLHDQLYADSPQVGELLPDWTYEAFLEHVHAEDRAYVDKQFKDAIERNESCSFQCRVRRADGELRWVWVAGKQMTGNLGDSRRMVGLARDITDEKRNQERVLYQAEFQRLVAEISTDFLHIQRSNFDETLLRMLERVCVFFETDRAYLFQFSEDGTTMSNTHEWCAEGISWQRDSLQNLPVESFPWLHEQLLTKGCVHIPDIDELPPEAGAEHAEAIRAQAKALLCVPVAQRDGRVVGFFGFDSVRRTRRWDDEEIVMLRVLSNLLVEAFAKIESEQSLVRAKEKAEAADLAKSQFVANMSHEIRTPLNAVIGFTELIKNTPLNRTQAEYASHAHTSAQTLLEIVNDILDFSKIQSGKLELEFVKTDLAELIGQACEIVTYLAVRQGVELLVHAAPDLPEFVVVDPVRLKQVMVNLLTNAVKFTEQGEVELQVRFARSGDREGTLQLAVRDTGVGISPEQQQKLFEAFTQADTSTTRKFGGTGLGLIISQSIAEKMGSSLEISSEPGEGSVFSLALDLAYEDEPQSAEEGASELVGVEGALVVDDNRRSAEIISELLERRGIRCSTCRSGQEATAELEASGPFDLLVVDYRMPELSGFETLSQARERAAEDDRNLPAVILHEILDEQEVSPKATEIGACATVVKPVRSATLYAAIAAARSGQAKHGAAKHSSAKHRESEHGEANRGELERGSGDAPPAAQRGVAEPSAEAARRGAAEPSAPPAGCEDGPTVLVVDDTTVNLTLSKALLREWLPAARVLEAQDGREAVEIASTREPDGILLDIHLPEIDGIEAARRIRANEHDTASRRVPIVALTADAQQEMQERCFAAGIDEILLKPIDQDALRNALERNLPSVESTERSADSGSGREEHALPSFDKDALKRSVNLDCAVYTELVSAALTDLPAIIEQLEHGAVAGDCSRVREVAHSLKGVAGHLKLERLVFLAEQLSAAAKGRADDLPRVAASIRAEWEAVQEVLTRERA